MPVLTIQNSVPNRIFGMPDFPYLKARMQDFKAKWGRDSGLTLCLGPPGGARLLGLIFARYGTYLASQNPYPTIVDSMAILLDPIFVTFGKK